MPFDDGGGGGAGGVRGMLTRKVGPLPVWAWGGLGLGAALAVASWRRSKGGAGNEGAAAPGVDDGVLDALPETLQPIYVDADQYTITLPEVPPGGGRPPTSPAPETPPAPPTAPAKTPPKPRAEYRAKKGDTLEAIAKKYGLTWQALFRYNTTPGVRPADTIQIIKNRGPKDIHVDSLWLIPPKSWK